MKQQLNVRVSKATREKVDFLTNNLYGTQAETIAVAVDRLYQARKAIELSLPIWQHLLRGEKMKRLWVVDFQSGNVPAPDLVPDYESYGIEVIIADQFFAVVSAEHNELNRIISKYPYCHISHPADGRWVSEGGDEVYIHNATLIASEPELWNLLGLKPATFGGETWDEVDKDVVRDHVPTF